jgi:hypothetical protein
VNPLLLLGWQRYAIYGALILAIGSAVWIHGYSRGEIKLWEYQAEQAKAAVPIVIKQGEATEKIVVKWRTRTVEIVGATQTLEKEIVRYVPPAADPVLGLGWLHLHDAAATRTVPEAPKGADVAAPAIAASTALRGIIGNYGACHATAAQLLALQEWIRSQYQVANVEALGY